MEGISPRPLFFTRAALPWVEKNWDVSEPEKLLGEYELTLQMPQAWRVLDRERRFGAVLLMGDPATFRTLLDALRQAPDWVLTRIDATSYLFERSPTKEWDTETDLPALLQKFDRHSSREQVMARVQIAHRLMFIDETEWARELLDEVLETHPRSREAWAQLAILHGMNREWEESADAARRALKLACDYRPARIALASALFAMNQSADAFPISRKLYRETPDDSTVLYLYAQIAHAVHAYKDEIEVLQRLIAMLERYEMPTGAWQIYLGQAYSATGQAASAQTAFQAALADETLHEMQRTHALRALERLRPE